MKGGAASAAREISRTESLTNSPPSPQPRVESVYLSASFPVNPEAEELLAGARKEMWTVAAIYAAAGFAAAAVLAGSFLLAGHISFAPMRFLLLLWSFAWPAALGTVLITGSTRTLRLLILAIYFSIYCAIAGIGILHSPDSSWRELALLWVIISGPPSVLLWAFLNRRIRAVGPMVFAFLFVAITGSQLAISVAGSRDAWLRRILRVTGSVDLGATGTLLALICAGFLILSISGWLILRWIGRLYEKKKISDQSILLDSLWILFAPVCSISVAHDSVALAFAGIPAFLIYKLIVRAAFFIHARRRPIESRPRLLLLRVFSLGKRSEQLFTALAMEWRFVGSIRLIAGPDLARKTIEPHEFLDFLGGRIGRRLITGPVELNRRFAEMDERCDPDGRFRVNDFFCRDDTWKMVFARLAVSSDSVLTDLRGFGPGNLGCAYEIGELLNLVPLERVVFLVDGTTRRELLMETLDRAAAGIRSDSPNHNSAGKLRFYKHVDLDGKELRQLVRSLSVSARKP